MINPLQISVAEGPSTGLVLTFFGKLGSKIAGLQIHAAPALKHAHSRSWKVQRFKNVLTYHNPDRHLQRQLKLSHIRLVDQG